MLEARQDKVVIQKYDISCGAAALATVLTYGEGDRVTEPEVATGLLAHTSAALVRQRQGFSLLDLKQFVQRRGLSADGYSGLTIDDLTGLGAVIVPIQVNGFSHFVVFRGISGDRVLLADPAYGNRTMQVGYFTSIWEGNVGFTVARADGSPIKNGLVPQPSDFWTQTPPTQHSGSAHHTDKVIPPPEAQPGQVADLVTGTEEGENAHF
jgi:predicted double-glycine peptidase